MGRVRLRSLRVWTVLLGLAVVAGVAYGAKCDKSLKGCAECAAKSSACTLCRAGYRLSARKCQACTANCLLCRRHSTACEKCADGYYRTVFKQCDECQEGCAGRCASDGSCRGRCASGYGKIGGNCVKCEQGGCANCDGNAASCRRCEALGYGLMNGSCQPCTVDKCSVCNGILTACQTCAFGQYRTRDKQCQSCPTGCMEGQCRPDGTCKQCKPKYGLVGGYCKSCYVNGCLRCDGSQFRCTQCERNRGLMSPTECLKCDTTVNAYDTCEYCDGNPKRCSQCSPLEFLMPNKLCQLCSRVLENCASCTDAVTCTKCWVGFALVRGRCVACPPGCDSCPTGNPKVCQRCSPFHVLDSGTKRCIPL